MNPLPFSGSFKNLLQGKSWEIGQQSEKKKELLLSFFFFWLDPNPLIPSDHGQRGGFLRFFFFFFFGTLESRGGIPQTMRLCGHQ